VKTVKRYCVNFSCPTVPKAMQTDHLDMGLCLEEGKSALFLKLKCMTCNHESNEVVPKVPKKKRVGKEYHEGLGRTFDDADHEKRWAKANGYEAV